MGTDSECGQHEESGGGLCGEREGVPGTVLTVRPHLEESR